MKLKTIIIFIQTLENMIIAKKFLLSLFLTQNPIKKKLLASGVEVYYSEYCEVNEYDICVKPNGETSLPHPIAWSI